MSLRDKYTREEWAELEKEVLKKPVQFNFKGGMNKDTPDNKLDPKEYVFAKNYSLIEEQLKQSKKETFIIEQIINKVEMKKGVGIIPKVAVFSPNDYSVFNNIRLFTTDYIEIMGVKLKVHSSPKAKDGEIEIY